MKVGSSCAAVGWAQVDAGADYVVSQLVFDATVFQRFVADCRSIGIRCLIVPGVMPITGTACTCSMRHATHSLDRALVPDCPWVSCVLALPPARPALAIVLVLPVSAPVGGPVPEKSTHQL